MTNPAWSVSGQYYETCSCDYTCPCVLQQMTARPSKGTCTFAMGYQIERGSFGETPLGGLGFMVLGFTPEEMIKGNWSVGLIIDDRATPAQRDAITAIASGAAGGPMAGLSGLIGKFLGAESSPIDFISTGLDWSVKAGRLAAIEGKGAVGINPGATAPLQLSNTGHPASDVVNLAFGLRSRVDALGLSWSDSSGKHAAQYAPFSWRSA